MSPPPAGTFSPNAKQNDRSSATSTNEYTPPSSNDESPSVTFLRGKVKSSAQQLSTASRLTSPASPPSSSSESSRDSLSPYIKDEDDEMLDFGGDQEEADERKESSSPDGLFFSVSSAASAFQGDLSDPTSQFSSQHTSPREFLSEPTQQFPDVSGLRLSSRIPSSIEERTVQMSDIMLGADTLPEGMNFGDGMEDDLGGFVDDFILNDDTTDRRSYIHQSAGTPLSSFHDTQQIFSTQQSQSIQTAVHPTSKFPYTLQLLGIPPQGAKSRVETQIKLDLQLLSNDSDVVGLSDQVRRERAVENLLKESLEDDEERDRAVWMRLPSYGVSKEKWRASNLKDAPRELDAKGVLKLEATVVCSSNHNKSVYICDGCITRERKRSQRKKDYKRKTLRKTSTPPSPPLPPEEDRRIIVFNCPEIVDFSTCSTSLPTRITCYCRHHKEKIGFRVVLRLKRAVDDVLLGECLSGNIMITDDHKAASKMLQAAVEVGLVPDGHAAGDDGRLGNDDLKGPSGFPGINFSYGQNKGSFGGTTPSTSGSLNGLTQNMPSQAGPIVGSGSKMKIPRNLSMTKLNHKLEPLSTPGLRQGPYPQSHVRSPGFGRTHSVDSMSGYFQQHQLSGGTASPTSAATSTTFWRGTTTAPPSRSSSPPDTQQLQNGIRVSTQPQGSMLGAVSLSSTVAQGSVSTSSTPLSNAASPEETDAGFGISHHHQRMSWSGGAGGIEGMPGAITIPADSPRSVNVTPQQQQQMGLAGQSHSGSQIPVISRIVPGEGPTRGGIEVTILGQGFFEGIRATFGENPAVPTHCWSSTTLVCLLPPSATPGPVVVGLKNDLSMPLGYLTAGAENTKFFTYVNETDRALMELALQVVGLKMTGRIDTARNIAMKIVGQGPAATLPGQGEGVKGLGFEGLLLKCLDLIDLDASPYPAKLGLRNAQGQSMLHLACMMGLQRLVAGLLARGVSSLVQDVNGWTALHYASWLGWRDVVEKLLARGDERAERLLSIKTYSGKSALDLAGEGGRDDVSVYLDPVGALMSAGGRSGLNSRASSFASFGSAMSFDSYLGGSEFDEADEEAVVEDEDEEVLWIGPRKSRSATSLDSIARTQMSSLTHRVRSTPSLVSLAPRSMSDTSPNSIPSTFQQWLPPSSRPDSSTSTLIPPTPTPSQQRRSFFPSLPNIPRPQLPTMPDWSSTPNINMHMPNFPAYLPSPAMFQAYLQQYINAMGGFVPHLPLAKHNPVAMEDVEEAEDRKDDKGTDSGVTQTNFDLPPPPSYSELFPAGSNTTPVSDAGMPTSIMSSSRRNSENSSKPQFSLATRLSLRGRGFLKSTGLAGEGVLSREEEEALRNGVGRRSWQEDWMLIFFWVPVLVLLIAFMGWKGLNLVRNIVEFFRVDVPPVPNGVKSPLDVVVD